jgi:molecular chaperone DnaJ
MSKKDYYEILNVNKDASEAEIKKQFRKLSKLYHPDKQVGKSDNDKKNSEELFKEVNEAYSILGDKEKRQKYDQFGPDLGTNMNFNSNFNDLDDIFRSFMGGQFQQESQGPAPIRVSIKLSLNELFNGITKKFKYKANRVCHHCHGDKFLQSEGGKKVKCNTCNGNGLIQIRRGPMIITQTCPTCGGVGYHIDNGCKICNSTGLERIENIVEVVIPRGTLNNSYLIFSGKGDEIIVNGKSVIGDLIVIINELSNDIFSRNGNDLHRTIECSIYDCLLGEEITVETIDNKKHKFKLKIGTENGNIFKLSGCGMPIANTNEYGNLYAHIKHIIPNELNETEIKLLTKLKNETDGKKL